MAARKPPRTASLLRAPAPPPAAEDPREVERFIRGESPPSAPHDVPRRFTTPHNVAERPATSSGGGRRDGSRALTKWSDGSEVRRHTVYLPAALSARLMRICKAQGVRPSKAFEQAIVGWVEGRAGD